MVEEKHEDAALNIRPGERVTHGKPPPRRVHLVAPRVQQMMKSLRVAFTQTPLFGTDHAHQGVGQVQQGESTRKTRPGDRVLRKKMQPRRGLRIAPQGPQIIGFIKMIATETPLIPMVLSLFVLWLLFGTGIYIAERGVTGTSILSYGDALYCALAAFTTAGITNIPVTAAGKVFCGIWMVLGSVLFIGTIVATVTAYIVRPRYRPMRQIITTIVYNILQLEKLNRDELETLKETTDLLIDEQIRRLDRKAMKPADKKDQGDSQSAAPPG